MESKSVGCGTIIKRWLIFGGIILVLIIVAANTGKDKTKENTAPTTSAVSALPDNDITPQPTATEGPTATPKPTRVPTATASAQTRLQYAFEKSLGSSNRKDVIRVAIYVTNYDPPEVIISWAINDNLTEGLIRGSAKRDIALMLKTLDDSGIRFDSVRLTGSFSLADQYGKATEETVVKAVYKWDTVQRINWAGFLNDNVYAIADTLWLHRLFQER